MCVRLGCQCQCICHLYQDTYTYLDIVPPRVIELRAYAIWDDRSQLFWHHCLLRVICVRLGCQCRCICHLCQDTYTYLDLVPLVTSSDELTLSGTIVRNCFGVIPFDFHFFQILFKCLALRLPLFLQPTLATHSIATWVIRVLDKRRLCPDT